MSSNNDTIVAKLKRLDDLIKTLPRTNIDLNASYQSQSSVHSNSKPSSIPWYFNSAPSPILRLPIPNDEGIPHTTRLFPMTSSTPFPLEFVAPLPKVAAVASTPWTPIGFSFPSSSSTLSASSFRQKSSFTPLSSTSLASSTIDLSSTLRSMHSEAAPSERTRSTPDLSSAPERRRKIQRKLLRRQYYPWLADNSTEAVFDSNSLSRYTNLLSKLNTQYSVERNTRAYKERKYKDEHAQRMAQIRAAQDEIRMRAKATGNRQIQNEENTRLRLELEGLILERVPKEDEFPELSDDALAVINKAWNRNLPLNEVLTKGFSVDITRRDLLTIRGLEWLNDEVINFYMNLIIERSRQNTDLPKVYSFNTFFYQNISSKGYDSVKRWTRKIDIFSYDILIVPVHLTAHWCLATVDFKQKCIAYYDSMFGNNVHCLQLIKEYLEQEHRNKKNADYNTGDWRTICRKDIPRQHNGSDCGMFACKFAEYASRRAEINFNQSHMPYFRERMVYEICAQKLM